MANTTSKNGKGVIDRKAAAERGGTEDSYLRLVEAFALRRIVSADQHAAAKRRCVELAGERLDRGSSTYLDVLIDLIADYERRAGWDAGPSVAVAELVRHRIEERGMSVGEMARRIGVGQPNLSAMLNGRRGWSKRAIAGLRRELHIAAERFLD